MAEGDVFDHVMNLSLPPTTGERMDYHVRAHLAQPFLQRWQASSPPGVIAAMFMVDDLPFQITNRTCLSIDPDPLALLPLMVQMTGPSSDDISSAFTRLLDTPYRGRPWGQVIQSLYYTSCPACWRPTTAHTYHWQGYPPSLVSRELRCDKCGYEGESAADPEDQALAAEASPGRALHWEMMAKVVPEGHAVRARVEQALAFYTPRNLWVLMQTLRMFEQIDMDIGQRRAVQWLLSIALWQGSSLAAQAGSLWQQTLRRPYRFVERNLWLVLHEALRTVQSETGRISRRMVERPEEITRAETDRFWLAQRWPHQSLLRLPEQSVDVALISVPPALPLYWLLRFVWSGWLFGRKAAAPLLDLVDLRSSGGDKLTEILTKTMASTTEKLSSEGKVVVQWRWRGQHDPSAAVLAAFGTHRFELAVAQSAEDEYMALAYTSGPEVGYRGDVDHIASGALAMHNALRMRGEPIRSTRLRPYILAAWQAQGSRLTPEEQEQVLQKILDPRSPPERLVVWNARGESWSTGDVAWWWLQDVPSPWDPASDEAERALTATYLNGTAFDAQSLKYHLIQDLAPGIIPDLPWIDALIASYCVQEDALLVNRSQDDIAARTGEIGILATSLTNRGRDFGFDVTEWSESGLWTVEWQRNGRPFASFLLSFTTALTPRLWLSRIPIPGLHRYLVLPGGRAGLVQWRSDHQPLWASAISAAGWHMVKFRHLRDVLEDVEDVPERWLNHLILDPITDFHPEQMRLL